MKYLLPKLLTCALASQTIMSAHAQESVSLNLMGSTQAAYSFRKMARADEQGGTYNPDVEVRHWNENDYFFANVVVDDHSFLYDLGYQSCQKVQSQYPDEHENRPLVWLGYSNADLSSLSPHRYLPVEQGHCYLLYGNDSEGRIVALFHVKEHIRTMSVVLDEIQVIEKMEKAKVQ